MNYENEIFYETILYYSDKDNAGTVVSCSDRVESEWHSSFILTSLLWTVKRNTHEQTQIMTSSGLQ